MLLYIAYSPFEVYDKHLLSGSSSLLLPHPAAPLSPSLDLGLEVLFSLLLSLEGVDVLDKDTLVPECVTLGLEVELPVQVSVDLLVLPALAKSPPENPDPADPLPLAVKSGILGTPALTVTTVPAEPLGLDPLPVAGLGVHADWPAVDDTVIDELTDLLTGVSHSNCGDFGFIHPNTAETALKDGSGKALLQLKRRHLRKARPASNRFYRQKMNTL